LKSKANGVICIPKCRVSRNAVVLPRRDVLWTPSRDATGEKTLAAQQQESPPAGLTSLSEGCVMGY